MKRSNRAKELINNFLTPAKWFEKKYLKIIICFYMSTGFLLRLYFKFPYFFLYFCIFSIIGIIAGGAIYYYIKNFSNTTALTVTQQAAQSANAFYYKQIYSNPIYAVFPFLIVFIFGYGGCNMFDALSIDLLFVWIMILFAFVVYISIVGYIQYIFLAIYIFKLASSKHEFSGLSHSIHECIPAEVEWIQNLTKISHIYRNAFFTIGSLYIIAFGAFCYLPEFEANRESLAYYVLWSIIILAIVLVFPIVSILNYIWIKKIVEKIKHAYISDLETEADYLKKSSKKEKKYQLQTTFFENIYALKIKESRNYPITSGWSTGYSVILSLFNFLTTIIAIIKEFPTFLGVLHQIL